MSDLASNVTWQEILNETRAGNIPHCRAIASPSKWHEEITKELATIILGRYQLMHPDLLIPGLAVKQKSNSKKNQEAVQNTEEEATTACRVPNIEDCRELINDIALKPAEAEKRLAVINFADKLLLPAANSLLKLAEEPPEHAYLLFLMEDGNLFLPTLRSRSRFSVLLSEEQTQSYSMPTKIPEWIEWLANSRKTSKLEDIINNLNAWSNFAVSVQDFACAEKINTIKLIAEKKNLSVSMMCDMILLTLREENNYIDDFFDDLW